MAAWWTVLQICIFIQSLQANTLTTRDELYHDPDASSAMFELLMNRISMLENRLDARDQRIDLLEETLKIRDDKIEKLEEKLTEHDRYINVLREQHQSDTTTYQKDIGNIDDKINESIDDKFTGNLTDQSDELGKEEQKQYAATSRIAVKSRSDRAADVKKVQTQGTRIRRSENTAEYAFFATLATNLNHIGQQQDVVFDHVVTNIGNAYNNVLGAFIAPVPGTYVFSVSLNTYGHHTTHYGIYKNTTHLTTIWLNGADNNYDSNSQTVVLHLAKGDTVTVKHVESDHMLPGGDHCLFSGFLLTEEFTDSSSAIVG